MFTLFDDKNACCFTGHRPEKLPWGTNEQDPRCLDLKQRIYDAAESVYLSGVRHFICGMARGCDFYFCEEILRLRTAYPDITLEAAIPCEGQASRWTDAERTRYFRLVHQCDRETLLQSHYSADCMLKRNRYMVDHACILIAVFSGSLGGTMQTISYARKQGLELVELKP